MRRLGPLLCCVAVLAVGCSDSKGSSGAKDAPGGESPEQPRRGGVLRVGAVGPEGQPAVERLASLDPAQARSGAERLVARQVFESLTSYDPASLEVRPGLAASWQASLDLRQWDFRIRPGATFHNGRPVTSLDVKYSLERVARQGSSSPGAVQLEPVSGYRAFNGEGAPELVGITTPAADVVHVSLDQPLAALPALLGAPFFAAVPKEAVEAAAPVPAFAVVPIGSGPFMVLNRQPDVLHLTHAPESAALLDGVDVVFQPSTAAAYSSFAAGELDWAPVPATQVDDAVRRRGRDGFRPYQAELFFGLNLKNPKFADPRFRMAITHAVNRDAIVGGVYGGAVAASGSLVPAGTPGHQEGACGDRCRHDPARSRALVAEVFGTLPPPEVFVDYDDDPTQAKIAQRVQADLVAVGIPAAVRPHPEAEYLKFAVSGQQELFRLGWIGAYPSPEAFLTPLFASGAPDNVTGFSAPAVDLLLSAARAELDPAKRTELYRQAERTILEQLPVLPLVQFETHSVAGERVRALVVSGAGIFDASTVWFAPGK